MSAVDGRAAIGADVMKIVSKPRSKRAVLTTVNALAPASEGPPGMKFDEDGAGPPAVTGHRPHALLGSLRPDPRFAGRGRQACQMPLS
jgi:hypothetical protein